MLPDLAFPATVQRGVGELQYRLGVAAAVGRWVLRFALRPAHPGSTAPSKFPANMFLARKSLLLTAGHGDAEDLGYLRVVRPLGVTEDRGTP